MELFWHARSGTRMPKIDFLKPPSVLEQFFSPKRSFEVVFGPILNHLCMFLVGLLAFLEKQFCSLRCEVCNCYCPYLFQSMILSFPFLAFSLIFSSSLLPPLLPFLAILGAAIGRVNLVYFVCLSVCQRLCACA